MKSPLKKSIGEVVTDYGARVMKVFKKGLLQRSLFDFYGDVKADKLRVKESSSVPSTPIDGDGGVIYTKSADGKLYYKSNEVSEVELSAAGTVLTTEQVQDIVGAMFSSNTETNITVTYQDADGTIDLVATDTNTQLTTEEVQDIVGAMFTSNTETRISATYEDSDGTIDLVVDAIPVDLTSDGAGTIHANNVPTLNQDTTGNAATATTLTGGDKSLDGIITAKGYIVDGDRSVTAGSDGVALHLDAQDITDGSTSASGTTSFYNHAVIENPRLLAGNSNVTTTTASTLYIKGAPVAHTNQTITNAYALYAGGDSYFGGDIIVAGNDIKDDDGTTCITFDSSGNTTITGDLKVTGNDIKDSGGNTIISSDGSGVVSLAGGNIGFGTSGGSQNYNLNINSGSDIILEADQNGGGGDSTIQYPDSGGTNRIMLAADSDVVILSNRASNGTVQIRANTSTAGGSGEVTVVTVQDTQVDISKDLNVTGIITGKQREIYSQSFLDDLGTTKHYLPFKDINEQTTIYQEEAAMIMPCDGRIVSVTVKTASITGSGNMTIGVNTIGPNVNIFSTGNWTEEETETLAVTSTDDYHVFHFAFDNTKHFESGDLVTISIQNDADLSGTTYWWVSTVVEYNWNTFLGTTSAEYDSNP